MNDERRGFAECASSAAAFGSVGVLVALAQSEHVGTTTLLPHLPGVARLRVRRAAG